MEVMEKRRGDVERLKKGVDVLIVGGGITGAGVFNMLSGLKIEVALVDSNDFAFGTSSRSSKLIHGGLRYLANGQFSVVRDSVRERDFLLEKSGVVQRENFLIPLDEYSWSRYSLSLGLWLYSFFSRNIKAEWYSMERISALYPYLEKTPQRGGYVYAEGVVDDSRLVINTIMSGKMEGGIALNYARVKSISFNDGEARDAVIIDRIRGEEFHVPFRIMINSAGPWVGSIFSMMKEKYEKIERLSGMLKLSKGDHIVVSREKFPLDIALTIRSQVDGRQVFIIPRGEVVIVGTTETYYSGSLENPVPSEKEIEYLIESVKRYMKISRDDVLNAYSGIRPLFGKSQDLGKISREYRVLRTGNVINILGGKITTYRTVARKVSREVMRMFSKNGDTDLRFTYRRSPESEMDNLSRKYSITRSELKFAYDIVYEDAFHLDDILWRREGDFIFSRDAGVSKINDAVNAMKKVLNYTDETLENEKLNYLRSIYK